MNNAKPPYTSSAQEVFGGLFTEATPESLPSGASPQCINCEFEIGTVFPRPGKQNVYYYSDFFVTDFPAHAESDPGAFAPHEVPWTNPSQVTKGIPGVYASAEINHPGSGVQAYVDFANISDVNHPNFLECEVTANVNATVTDLAIYVVLSDGGAGIANSETNNAPAAFSHVVPGFAATGSLTTGLYGLVAPGTALDITSQYLTSSIDQEATCSILIGMPTDGNLPAWTTVAHVSGVFGDGNPAPLGSGTAVVPAGQPLLFLLTSNASFTQNAASMNSLIDNHGNNWQFLGQVQRHAKNSITLGYYGVAISAWICTNPIAASDYTFTANFVANGGFFAACNLAVYSLSHILPFVAAPQTQVLLTNNYNFAIPSTQGIFGFEVLITGHQTNADPSAVLTVSLNAADNPTVDSPTIPVQLPSSDGTVIAGSPTETWGLDLTNALLNNPNFGISIVGSANLGVDTAFFISGVQIRAYLTPNPAPNVNYIKTFTETGGEILTLALLSSGSMAQEDVVNNPGVLSIVYNAIEPDTFAQSATIADREFIALSNLKNGTDIPYTYTPPNFDRLSQVGPGLPPTVTTSTTSAAINVVSITQAPATQIRRIAWGASSNAINDSTAGNILVIFGEGRTSNIFQTLPNAVVGGTIWLSGLPSTFPKKGGGSFPYNLNSSAAGAYTILQVTTAIVGGNETCPVFTVQAPAVEYGYSNDFGSGGTPTSGWFYQATLATLTVNTQIPNLEVGGTLQLAGTGGSPVAGYDGSWTVLSSPNATTLLINTSALVNNVATFSYTVIGGGPNPVVGQLITIQSTTNGNGIFNKANLSITATSPGSFSVGLNGANIPTASESGSGQIFGTVFTFEPLQLVGTRSTGTVQQQGVILAGQRKVCYSFLTRNGFLTKPSPITTITIAEGAGALVVSDLLVGPSNVIARVVHLTATNGGNFYNIPEPVTVVSNDQNVINTATWLNDNTSRQITLSFDDAVLLAGEQIDIEGNNLFECAELGSPTMIVPYASRAFAIGEQNKLTNLLNWSFDGGIAGQPGSLYPAGWTVDPTNGSGGTVVNSPIFGFAYQISNTSGVTKATWGMITQPAFQDEFQVAIIEPSTTYSVRLTASVPTGAASGNLVVDLYSPSAARILGSYTLPLASISTSMLIFSGTLLTTVLAPVPNDLLLRIYATNIPTGVTINLDRIEPFPTEQPNLNQQVTGSYENNFEAFDQLTGVILGTNVNQQPIVTAFVLFDAFYLVKTGSIVSTSDNNTTEPDNWSKPRTISAAVGGFGPNAVTTGIDEPNSGEEWAIIAGPAGGFIYMGGQPISLTEEIKSVWDQIYKKTAYTTWVKNDIVNRRVLFGVPLNELNSKGKSPFWLPAGIIANGTNPQTPNVILELNYSQLNTGNALADSPGVHRTYSGKLAASEIVRKWSIWTIKAPCAAFVTRPDGTAPAFFGNSDHTGKIYDVVDGFLEDDGRAINQKYITSAFVSTEQGQGQQTGVLRNNYDYLTMLIDGSGTVIITVYPNTLDSPYSHVLLPNLTLPSSGDGDTELPVNECATRLFMGFNCNAVGAGFDLSRLVIVMHADPWSPVRGRNN